MSKKQFFLAVGIVAVSAIIYAWLGGFTSLSYAVVEHPEIRISGEEYIGRPTQPELEEVFYQYRDLADQRETGLVIITYPQPDTTAAIRQFIGIPAEAGLDGEVRSWPAGIFVRVELTNNLLVTPSPSDVRKDAVDFARKLNLELAEQSIEFYAKDRETVVLFPVKNSD